MFIKFGIPIPGIAYPVNPKRNMTIVIDDTPAPPKPKPKVEFAVPKAPLSKAKQTPVPPGPIVVPDEVIIQLLIN